MFSWFSDTGFQQNLAAGLIILLLEVALVVVLIPILLKWYLDRRWAPSRRRMWRSADRAVLSIYHNLKGLARRKEGYSIGDFVELMDSTRARLMGVMQTYAPALDPELLGEWNEVLDKFEALYTRVRFFEMPRMLSSGTSKKLAHVRQTFEELREVTSRQLQEGEDGGKRVRMQEFDEAMETLKKVVLKDWPERA
jgi:hypothetical protein